MDEQKKYISIDTVLDILASHFCACSDETEDTINSIWRELKATSPADVVPWSWLEQYAEGKRCNYASDFVIEARESYEM